MGTVRRRSLGGPVERGDRLERVLARRRPRSRAGRAASHRSRGAIAATRIAASRSPARASAAASESARNRQPACSRSSGAEPGVPRRDGQPVGLANRRARRRSSTGSPLLADHPADEEQLLRVLLAEVRAARPRRRRRGGARPSARRGNDRAAPRPRTSRRPDRDRAPAAPTPGGYTSSTARRPDRVDAQTLGRSRGPAASSRGYAARSSPGPNCRGLTKTSRGRGRVAARARRISEACPSCSAPIVGTSPTPFVRVRRRRTARGRQRATAVRRVADQLHAAEHVLDRGAPLGREPPGSLGEIAASPWHSAT